MVFLEQKCHQEDYDDDSREQREHRGCVVQALHPAKEMGSRTSSSISMMDICLLLKVNLDDLEHSVFLSIFLQSEIFILFMNTIG